MKGFAGGGRGWIGERGEVMGEARVRAKLRREADEQLPSFPSSESSDEASCCFVVVREGMTRWRVGAGRRKRRLRTHSLRRRRRTARLRPYR